MSDVHDEFDPFRRPATTSSGPAGSTDQPDLVDLDQVDITDARLHSNAPAGAAAPVDPYEASAEARRSDALAAWYTTAATPDGHLYGGDVEEGELSDVDRPNDQPAPGGDPWPRPAPDQEPSVVPDTNAWYSTADATTPEPSLFEPSGAAAADPAHQAPASPHAPYEQPRYEASRYGEPQPDQPQDEQAPYDQPPYDPPRYEQPSYQPPQYDQPPYERTQPPYEQTQPTSSPYAADPFASTPAPSVADEGPRFARPAYEEPIPAGHPEDPFPPSGYDAGPTMSPAYQAAPAERPTGPEGFDAAAGVGAPARPAAAPRRRPPSRRQRQRITFAVIFALVVLLGAAAAMVMNGRFDLPFGSGKKAPLPTCPSVAPTIQTFGETSVHVLNASKINGFALKTTKDLQKLGFKVPTTPGNEPATTKVTGAALVRYGPSGLAAANTVKSVVNGPVQLLQDGRPGTDVDLVLGATFKLKTGVKSVASAAAPTAAATCTPEPAAS